MNRHGFFKVAGAVPEVRVADCQWNVERMCCLISQAVGRGVELLVFPELSVTGYTCGDLFRQPQLLQGAERALGELIASTVDYPIAVAVGMPIAVGSGIYNCAVLFCEGEILGVVPKQHIPHHGGLCEGRIFLSGKDCREEFVTLCEREVPFGCDLIFRINGVECGVEIGEDLWAPKPPSTELALAGARCIVNLSALPESAGSYGYLRSLVEQQSGRLRCGYLYVSAGVGESTTDMLFGGKVLVAEQGSLLAEGERFRMEEQLVAVELDMEQVEVERRRVKHFCPTVYDEKYATYACDFEVKELPPERRIDPMPFVPTDEQARRERCEEVLEIQSLALAKRMTHTGCRSVVMGVSGGLDSTLALLVAVRTFDKLGLDRRGIYGITMPGFGTTDRTYHNALDLMSELGITQKEISICDAVKQHFADIELDPADRSATYENSQARERTQILMDYANKVGGLVVGTGDLSELALGWATFNGDHMSMYGVNGSIPKTLVRHLVRSVAEQTGGRVGEILLDVVDTPVSPELLPADERGEIAQKTEDLVGPYELHDLFLYHFVRRGVGPQKLLYLAENAFAGRYSREEILKWMERFFGRFFAQQFKRSTLPDGPKTGSVSLSPRGDWQMPSDASAALWLAEIELLKQLTDNE